MPFNSKSELDNSLLDNSLMYNLTMWPYFLIHDNT